VTGERLFVRLGEDGVQGPEGTVPAATLRALPVRPELRGYVGNVLSYRESFAAGDEVLERVLPDGALRLMFNLGEAPEVQAAPAARMEAVGASCTPVLVRLRGQVHGLSLTLRVGAAAALLGVPAGELTEATAPLEILWGADGRGTLERLAESGDDAQRAALLQELLARRLGRADPSACRAARRAVELIRATDGRRSVRELASAIGVGERRLQQLFHAHVGLSPRALSRLARLEGCLRALRAWREPRWAELALRAGFYDQAHLANEFRALCGMTPREFLVRRSSGSSKTPGSGGC
jgi:AraC-like DNA-binding protein